MRSAVVSFVTNPLSKRSPEMMTISAFSVLANKMRDENAPRSSFLRTCAFCTSNMENGASKWISAVCMILGMGTPFAHMGKMYFCKIQRSMDNRHHTVLVIYPLTSPFGRVFINIFPNIKVSLFVSDNPFKKGILPHRISKLFRNHCL